MSRPGRRLHRHLAGGLALVLALPANAWIAAGTARAQSAPPPAIVADTAAAAAAPQSKPLLILNLNGKVLVLKTRATRQQPGVLVVETLDGTAQTIAAAAYINQLPWYTDAEMESGRIDLNALAIRYRAFAGLYAEARPTLTAEAQRFQDIAARTTANAAQRNADTQKRVADILASKFDPAADQNRDVVAAIVREGDELARLVPAQAAQITQATAAARDALAKLDAGQVFYEGRWTPGAEVAALRKNQEETAIRETFDRTLALPLSPLALGAGQVFALAGLPLLIILVLLIAGFGMLTGKRRASGVFVVAVALILGAGGYYLVTQDNHGALTVPSADATDTIARSNRLVAMLYRAATPAAAPQAEDRDLRLTSADLSSFLARHIQVPPGADGGLGLRRGGLALGVTREGFILFEPTTLAGLPISLRYDVKIDGRGEAPAIKSYSVRAGGLPLPDPFKGSLWSRLGPALGEYVQKHRLLEAYALTDMSRGEIRVASTRAIGVLSSGRPANVPAVNSSPTPAPADEPAMAAPTPQSTPTPSAFGSERGG